MFDSVRQAMLWAHRVLGLGFSGLLLIAFFMGSLALYDRELDSWMLPSLRAAPSTTALSLDRQVLPEVASLSEGKALLQWYVELPDARRPLMRFQAQHGLPVSGRHTAEVYAHLLRQTAAGKE